MRHATITATGSYVPARVLTHADLSAMLGEDIDPFVSGVLGIRERRVCGPGESTADRAEGAAREALGRAGLAPEEIDLLIVSTDTPEYISPATASVLQGRLGARRAGTFDVNSACAGFTTALDVELQARVSEAVAAVNRELSRPEQVGRFMVLARELSAEHEELTPTLKVRRAVVEARYRSELDALYSHPEP